MVSTSFGLCMKGERLTVELYSIVDFIYSKFQLLHVVSGQVWGHACSEIKQWWRYIIPTNLRNMYNAGSVHCPPFSDWGKTKVCKYSENRGVATGFLSMTARSVERTKAQGDAE